MSCIGLVSFNYDENLHKDAVKLDSIGNLGAFLCKPLAIACGREVSVSSSESGLTFLPAEKRSAIQRIFFGFVAIALLPLTLIGLLLLGCSKAHSSTYGLYSKNSVKPATGSETEDKTDAIALSTANGKIAGTNSTSNAAAPKKITTPIVTEADLIASGANWADKVSLGSNLPEALKKLKDAWTRSLAEEAKDKQLHASIAKFNDEAFASMKKANPSLENPRDFLHALNHQVMWSPIPVSDKKFEMEEGSYYRLDGPMNLTKITDSKELQDEYVFKYENGRIGIFVPKGGELDITVNSKAFPKKEGNGTDQPYYLFNEGDVIFKSPEKEREQPKNRTADIYKTNYLFTVGAKGSIAWGRQPVVTKTERQDDTLYFDSGDSLKYTSKKNTAEVEASKKLVPGFVFPEKDADKVDETGFTIVVDMEHDPIFKKLVEYFRKELELYKDQPELQIFRLAMFAADMNKSCTTRLGNLKGIFYLGDVVGSGLMDQRHCGLLVKALADQLNISCGLVAEKKVEFGINKFPTWNVFDINGELHVLDSNSMVAISIPNPLPQSYTFQAEFGIGKAKLS
jgi:hypothetical protein